MESIENDGLRAYLWTLSRARDSSENPHAVRLERIARNGAQQIMDKEEVYRQLEKMLAEKSKEWQRAWETLLESNQQEGKGSAGDKHETGKAMVHQEMELLGRQRQEIDKQWEEWKRTEPASPGKTDKIGTGQLVETTQGWYYIITSWGKLMVEAQTVFIISHGSPLAGQMIGKQAGDIFQWQGKGVKILSVT